MSCLTDSKVISWFEKRPDHLVLYLGPYSYRWSSPIRSPLWVSSPPGPRDLLETSLEMNWGLDVYLLRRSFVGDSEFIELTYNLNVSNVHSGVKLRLVPLTDDFVYGVSKNFVMPS